jgi:hypothetical protein
VHLHIVEVEEVVEEVVIVCVCVCVYVCGTSASTSAPTSAVRPRYPCCDYCVVVVYSAIAYGISVVNWLFAVDLLSTVDR